MDWYVYAVLFVCGLALYIYAYHQGRRDEARVFQEWLNRERLR